MKLKQFLTYFVRAVSSSPEQTLVQFNLKEGEEYSTRLRVDVTEFDVTGNKWNVQLSRMGAEIGVGKDTGISKEGENVYRRKVRPISAFKWDGNARDARNIPAWAKRLIRYAELNEATYHPPGLITRNHRVWSNGWWFVYDAQIGMPADNMFARTDEAFQRDYEENK